MICVVKIFNFLVLVGGIQIFHRPLQGLGNHPYSIIGITMKFAGLPITALGIVFLFILLWSLQRRKTLVLLQYLTFYGVASKPTPQTAPSNLETFKSNTEKAAKTKFKKETKVPKPCVAWLRKLLVRLEGRPRRQRDWKAVLLLLCVKDNLLYFAFVQKASVQPKLPAQWWAVIPEQTISLYPCKLVVWLHFIG